MNKFCILLATTPLEFATSVGAASTFGSNASGSGLTIRAIDGQIISAAAKFSF